MIAHCIRARAVLAWVGLLVGAGLAAAGAHADGAAAMQGLTVPAERHLQAAQVQSRGDPTLQRTVRHACARTSAPASATLAEQALRQTEADHQRERAEARPDAARLLQAVVLRGCAAYHATRLQPGVSYPVWLHTRLSIQSVRPAAGGLDVQARASSAGGQAGSARVTFSRGLHHACFVATDAAGLASCVMVDTHPHGDQLNGWAQAHEGPLVATYAGSVSATVVQLPAVEIRDFPVFASFAALPAGFAPAARLAR